MREVLLDSPEFNESNFEKLEDCWSMAVNFGTESFKSRSREWLEYLMDLGIVKVDTGQNPRYCVQVMRVWLGFCWQAIRSVLGWKELSF